MTRFFTRERFGRPQFLAGILLLCFLAQAIWLVRSELRSPQPGENGSAENESAENDGLGSEQARIAAGWRQLHGKGIAGAPYPDGSAALAMETSTDAGGFDTEHSPLLALVTAAPLLAPFFGPAEEKTMDGVVRWTAAPASGIALQ